VADALRKLLLAGLGTLDLTEEKVKAVFEDLVKRGEMNEKDAKEVISSWKDRANEQRQKVQALVDESVQKGLKAVGYVKLSDYNTLAARVAELERKLAAPAGQAEPAPPAAPAEQAEPPAS
jgi:polyhydroxyalkanoate synthesis regulator phasin